MLIRPWCARQVRHSQHTVPGLVRAARAAGQRASSGSGDVAGGSALPPWLRARACRPEGDGLDFLGRQRTEAGLDGQQRDFYVRQLRDWKFSVDTDTMVPRGMRIYGELCGWTLARAHARSGDPIAIAAYLGASDVFDQAITEFAAAYADQNERDHNALVAAAG